VASHHAIIDPILEDLRTELADLNPKTPVIPVFVTTGGRGPGTVFDAGHWVDNLRNPVRFTQAVAAAGAEHATFIEVSPHPLLSYAIDQSLGGVHHHTLGTLQRETNDTITFRAAVNAAHTVRPPDLAHPAEPRIVLPATPWHHTRHWLQITPDVPAAATVAKPATHDWFHELAWPVRDLPAAANDDSWLVIAEDTAGAEIATALGNDSRTHDAADLESGPHAADALREALTGVDYLLYAPAPVGRVDAVAGYRLFRTARRLLNVLAGMPQPPKLMILTRNAQPISEGDRADAAHAVLWGMARTIRLEHPEFWGGIVDVDQSAPAELVCGTLAAEVAGAGEDDQAVHRRGLRHVPRIEPRPVPAVALTRFEGNTSHLVIGATGNVGPYLIRQLAEMGAGTVVAVSRRGPGQLTDLRAELESAGTTLVEVAADVADEAAMSVLFDRFGDDLPPLEGVYLAALAGGEALLTEMTDADIATMFRPKLDAAVVLHRLTLRHRVRRFVLFSSITGLLGSRMVGHYTAANAFADTLAYARRALGLSATVVDWGLWKSWADAQPSTKAAGLQPMPNDVAIRMLPLVLSPDAGVQSVVAGADWQRLSDAYAMRAPMPILSHLLAGGDTGGVDQLPHPEFGTLLGEPAGSGPAQTWRAALLPDAKPYPGGHRVRGVEVVPVSVLLQTLAATGYGSALGDVRFEYPVVAEAPRAVQVVIDGENVRIASSTGPTLPADRWTRHVSARVIDELPAPAGADAEATTPEIAWDPTAIGELQRASGVDGQPLNWTVAGVEAVPGGLRATVDLPQPSVVALVDAAVHLARLLDDSDALMLPAAAEALVLAADLGGADTVEVLRRGAGPDLVVDITARSADGSPCVDIRGLRYALVDSAAAEADTGAAPAPIDAPEWSELTPEETVAELRVRLRAILARELGMPAEAVDYDRPFPELGLDSMMAMTLLRDAKQLVQMELSATMLWNNPTLAAFADHVAGMLAPQSEPEPAPIEEETDDSVSLLDALFDSVEGSGFETSLEGEAR